MRIRFLFLALFLCLGFAVQSRADVLPASIFGNGMVLQRQMKVPVWGTADAEEPVSVMFAGQTKTTRADAHGKWKISLDAMEANATAAEMTLAGKANTVVIKDIVVGEVWLCSGQSNMGLEVRKVINAADELKEANDPLLRCFTAVPLSGDDHGYMMTPTTEVQRYALRPQEKCLGSWKPTTPEDAKNFSACGYFFAKNLRKKLNVPIGIIVSSTGATAIESWISVEGLKAIPAYRQRAESFDILAKAYLADKDSLPKALEAEKVRIEAATSEWIAQMDAEEPGLKDKWMSPDLDVSKWGRVSLPVTVANNPLGAPVASIWFRKDVTIPDAWVGKELEVHLGTIDGVDETYVNNAKVGRTWFDTPEYWLKSRVYAVPAEATTSNHVTVTMRTAKLMYHLAPLGPESEMKIGLKGTMPPPPVPTTKPTKEETPKAPEGKTVSLVGEWRVEKSRDLDAGRMPMPAPVLGREPGHHYGHPGVQYNGLIHPIVPFAIRGAIWYQGEANAPFYIDYRSLMPGLIKSWRAEWGQGDFPFGIVQLADYFGQQTRPVERGGYVNLRESQAMAAQSVPNTFLATAVGVGEGADIHPKRKQEVGRRLALRALGLVYGEKDLVSSGPVFKSLTVEGSSLRLQFDFAKGLHAQGDPPVGFAIAGEDRAFYFANAKIDGQTIVVSSDKVPHPVAVRYAWATNPVCNIYNVENLPIFPFHSDSWDLSQLVITDDKITIPSGWVPK